MPTPRYALRLDPSEKSHLQATAAAHGLTLTDLLREGARQYAATLDRGSIRRDAPGSRCRV